MMIPVVFPVDKNYAIPLCVAITSLLENKFSGTEYDIYVLCSNDYALGEKNNLRKIAAKYDGVKINFISMGNEYDNVHIDSHTITKATYYRLSIHNLLPDNYAQCIYCDSDTIINCDLSNLFGIDLQGYFLAGAVDPVISYSGRREGFENYDEYINSGVLVINLKKWRELAIDNLFGKYINSQFKYYDQDILNLVCKDRILIFKDKYVISGVLNRRKYKDVEPAIIHYCGLIKPWDIEVPNPYFRLWTYYAKCADIDLQSLNLERKRKVLDDFIESRKIIRVIVWGMSASTLDLCYFFEELGLNVVAIGDRDAEKVKQGNLYYEMIDAEGVLDNREGIHYIVNTVKYYQEIKKQLIERGVSEGNIMCWQEWKQLMIEGK